MSDPYVYPGTHVLINRFDIRDADLLERIERHWVSERVVQGAPAGAFDHDHLRAIHHHLFQDVYDWAGTFRTVRLFKGDSQFMDPAYFHTGISDIHRRLQERDFLTGLSPEAFSAQAAEIIGDLNRVHPFREGNGRTQRIYLKQLAEQAGHTLHIDQLRGEEWNDASRRAHRFDFEPMQRTIHGVIADEEPDRGGEGTWPGVRASYEPPEQDQDEPEP